MTAKAIVDGLIDEEDTLDKSFVTDPYIGKWFRIAGSGKTSGTFFAVKRLVVSRIPGHCYTCYRGVEIGTETCVVSYSVHMLESYFEQVHPPAISPRIAKLIDQVRNDSDTGEHIVRRWARRN